MIYRNFCGSYLKRIRSIKFNERHFIQTHGVAMATKTTVVFSVIFMEDLEKRLLMANPLQPLVWKRFIDDNLSLCDSSVKEVYNFLTSLGFLRNCINCVPISFPQLLYNLFHIHHIHLITGTQEQTIAE